MGDIKVRGLSDAAIAKLTSEARRKGISREEYCRKYLESLAVLSELKDMEERYEKNQKKLIEILQMQSEQLNRIYHGITKGGQNVE